ncbi:MAG TPA: hypothetical protein VMF86_05505 [Stellaceae bacterium]|nr:hypothetical protein [Stellaceae bacterium]
MRLATPFDPIEPGEFDYFAFDFTADVGTATIVATSWSCELSGFGTAGDPAPAQRIVSAAPQTEIALRSPLDGTLWTKSGFFSVALVGGMPLSASGGTYILEATAMLSDGRTLKLNASVLCKAPGP